MRATNSKAISGAIGLTLCVGLFHSASADTIHISLVKEVTLYTSSELPSDTNKKHSKVHKMKKNDGFYICTNQCTYTIPDDTQSLLFFYDNGWHYVESLYKNKTANPDDNDDNKTLHCNENKYPPDCKWSDGSGGQTGGVRHLENS